MLQTPINVEPSGGRVKTVGTTISMGFTFQGDLLTFVQGQVRDMEDNDGASLGTLNYVMPKGGHLSVIHNGQKVSYVDSDGWMAARLTPGHNYKHFFRLFQHYPEGMRSGNTSIAGRPMPDMYYARGKIYQKNYTSYNNKSAYARGDVCTSSGYIYACNTAITKNEDDEYNSDGSSFNSSHWTRVYNYQTVIEPDLENIKAPFYYEWDTTEEGTTTHHKILLGAIYMDILYERHMISEYDKTTGIVTFQKVTFDTNTQGYTAQEVTNIQNDSLSSSSAFSISKHNAYKMYTNYLETGWYDFKWRNKPIVTTTIETSIDRDAASSTQRDNLAVGIDCEGTYSQSEAIGLKWYQYQLYTLDAPNYSTTQTYRSGDLAVYNGKLYRCAVSSTTGNFNPSKWWEADVESYGDALIDETDRIFSYDLQTGFPVHPFTYGHYVKLITSTQDDDTKSATYAIGRFEEDPEHGYDDINFTPISINGESYVANDNSNDITICDSQITLTWEVDGNYSFSIFRREVYRDGSVAQFAHYLGNATFVSSHNTTRRHRFIDYSAANNRTYQYEIVVKDDRAAGESATYGAPCCAVYIYNIHTKWSGWRIMSLTPEKDKVNRHYMKVGDEWTFISEIDSGDITRNITSTLHVGTAAYAKTTRNNTKYESGSFTANLMAISCPDNTVIDDIERVNKWMDFICGDNPFLLKSDKGDVWVVSIVNSPSRQYDESLNPILTKVRYEWAESKNVNRCVFD